MHILKRAHPDLPVFDEPAMPSRHDLIISSDMSLNDSVHQIIHSHVGEYLVRTVNATVHYPLTRPLRHLSLAQVLEVASNEHRSLEEEFGIPVVEYEYGYAQAYRDDIPATKQKSHSQNLCRHLKRQIPKGLLLAARVRILKTEEQSSGSETTHDDKDVEATERSFVRYQTQYRSSRLRRSSKLFLSDLDSPLRQCTIDPDTNRLTYVDIEPRLTASPMYY